MSDKNVKLFLLFAGFYFISKDVSALVVFSRRQQKPIKDSKEETNLPPLRKIS